MADLKGVSFVDPPESHIGPIMKAVNSITLSPGKKNAIVGLVNEHGVNAAIVVKTKHGFEVQAYIGKSWGSSLEYGAAVKKEW